MAPRRWSAPPLADNGQELLAHSLGVQARRLVMTNEPGDGLRSADGAGILFREAGPDNNEASARLSADALHLTRPSDESEAAGAEGGGKTLHQTDE